MINYLVKLNYLIHLDIKEDIEDYLIENYSGYRKVKHVNYDFSDAEYYYAHISADVDFDSIFDVKIKEVDLKNIEKE
ncbi:hypothetical protein FL857_11005 [Criibacterium bergeronii]|uniref:Uncharacterized protein n=1 Tax=Criibacterium bergeronii TaxID=1871336 RepID=A0A552UWW1_9FIRM|nr:hypothetical protein [Criibacterium bergeronii]TRW22699.1 hypothetical protein FL857_11005 [Criibacterium bergeronii]